jgi:hypothetical protein
MPDTPLVVGRQENKWGRFDIFNAMTKSKINFQSIRQYSRFILEVIFPGRMEANKILDKIIIKK